MKSIISLSLLLLSLSPIILDHAAHAETLHLKPYGLSIDIPDDWSKRQPKKSWTLFAYAKLSSGENINMHVLRADGFISIRQVPLEQTFHPYYDYIEVVQKKYEKAYDTDFFNCIYKLKECDLKKRMEGKYRLQYYVFQWIRDEVLFTVTITDSENNFQNNMPRFREILDSIQFDSAP